MKNSKKGHIDVSKDKDGIKIEWEGLDYLQVLKLLQLLNYANPDKSVGEALEKQEKEKEKFNEPVSKTYKVNTGTADISMYDETSATSTEIYEEEKAEGDKPTPNPEPESEKPQPEEEPIPEPPKPQPEESFNPIVEENPLAM